MEHFCWSLLMAMGGMTFQGILEAYSQPLRFSLTGPGVLVGRIPPTPVDTQYILMMYEVIEGEEYKSVDFAEIHHWATTGCSYFHRRCENGDGEDGKYERNPDKLRMLVRESLTGHMSRTGGAFQLQMEVMARLRRTLDDVVFEMTPTFFLPTPEMVALRKELCMELEGLPGVGIQYLEAQKDWEEQTQKVCS